MLHLTFNWCCHFNEFLFWRFRAVVFLEKNFSKTVPAIVLMDEDKKLIALVNRELKEYIQLMELIK